MSKHDEPSPVRPCRSIPFTALPRTSKLFSDYLYAPERVARFYEHRWEGVESLVRLAPTIAAGTYDRDLLADALTHQNRAFGASDKTFEHIELLRRPDSVAVVTGQQAGLFGGPLFTVHKALTAISLAQRMRDRGVASVPVFWIASEDHDFEEVSSTSVLGAGGTLETIRAEPCGLAPDRPVGHVRLCAEISHTVDALFDALPKTVFTDRLREDLLEAYAPGIGYAEAFARLMARLFAPFGVVLLDPLAPALKELASPTYAAAVERAPEIASALVERSNELVEAGYHAQVFTSPDMVPLFIMDDERRRAIVQRDGRFALKSGEREFDKAELLSLANECATCMSPNVTLRPAVQDTLLPTVAYVGGPAEVAYFAQLQPVYHLVGRPMPVIVPRASATLMDHDSVKTLQRYGICLEDLFEGHESVLAKIVEHSLDAPTAALFDEIGQRLDADLGRLRETLSKAEPTLEHSLDVSGRKMAYQLHKLRTRFVRAAGNRDETLRRRLASAESLLYPAQGPQERTLNVFSYLAVTGYGLLDDLARTLDPESRDHQLVNLGPVAAQITSG